MFKKLREKIISKIYKWLKLDTVISGTLSVMNLHTAQINELIDRLEVERVRREEMQKYFITEIQRLREELEKHKDQQQQEKWVLSTKKYH